MHTTCRRCETLWPSGSLRPRPPSNDRVVNGHADQLGVSPWPHAPGHLLGDLLARGNPTLLVRTGAKFDGFEEVDGVIIGGSVDQPISVAHGRGIPRLADDFLRCL